MFGLEVFIGDDKGLKYKRYKFPDSFRHLIEDAEKDFKPFEVDSSELNLQFLAAPSALTRAFLIFSRSSPTNRSSAFFCA